MVEQGGVAWISGIPGIGRRALVATVATEYVKKPGGVLWFHVYHDDLPMLANRFARAYGVAALSTDDVGTQVEVSRALLEQNKPLLIFDGPLSSTVIQQFIKQARPVSVPLFIAGNRHVDNGPWSLIRLEPLNKHDAENVYRERAGGLEDTRSALLAPLLNYVEGHPISLTLAAHQVSGAGISPSHLTSLLPSSPEGPQNRALGVYAAAYRLLNRTSQGVFLLLGNLFVDHASVKLMQAISGAPEDILRATLQDLKQRGFCEQISQPGQLPVYRVHDVARIFARYVLKSRQQLDSTRSRILQGIHKFIQQHTATSSEENYDLLAHEMGHILGAARYATTIQNRETLRDIFKMLGQHGTQNVIHVRGYQALYEYLGKLLAGSPDTYEDDLSEVARDTEEAALQGTAAETESQPTQEAYQPVLSLATTKVTKPRSRIKLSMHQLMTMSREALEDALTEALGAQDYPQAAQLARALGEWYVKHRQPNHAIGSFQQAADIYQRLEQSAALSDILEQLARSYLQVNKPAEAVERVERAIQLARELNKVQEQGDLLVLLGDAKTAQHNRDEALEAYHQAVTILTDCDDKVNTGLALGKIANLHIDQGKPQEATIVLARSIDLFEQAGRQDLLGRALGNLGTAFGRMGRWKEAGQRHMMARKIAKEREDIEEERFQLMNLAYVAEAEGHLSWAIHYNRQALYLALIASDSEAAALISFDLGRLLLNDANQLGQSIVLLENAQQLANADEAARLLQRARTRQQRLLDNGYSVPPAQTDLLTYAQSAYEESA
jgi:tetratricopeptide (TPR) repeat protein